MLEKHLVCDEMNSFADELRLRCKQCAIILHSIIARTECCNNNTSLRLVPSLGGTGINMVTKAIEYSFFDFKPDQVNFNRSYRADCVPVRAGCNNDATSITTVLKRGDNAEAKALKSTEERGSCHQGSNSLLTVLAENTREFMPTSSVTDVFERSLGKYREHTFTGYSMESQMEIKNTIDVHPESNALTKNPNDCSTNKEYDATKLAELLRKCRGTRTTTEFSKETGVSITYLTKLLNGNSPSRPSKKYLRRISYPKYGQNNSCDVSYEALLRAAGYSDEEIDTAVVLKQSSIELPIEAKRKSFPISFMIDNLFASGEINNGFEIFNSDDDGWFTINTMESKILCVPALYDGAELIDKEQRIANDFMIAVLTQKNLDKYYILTNQRNLVDDIKKVLPKLPGIDLYILITNDYHTISERELVY